MRKTFLFFVAILIIPSALAYPITVQLNGNMNFNTAVYHCSDAACTSTTSYTSTAGNPNTYTINNLGSGMQYFAEYDYVSDRCYVSHSYKNWFDESIGNGPWQYTINFQKQTACKSDINSVLFASSIYDNQTQQITARIKAPLNSNPGGPGIIPASLQYYYSTNVSVLIEVRNQTSLILSQIKSGDIIWNNSRDFAFTLPLLQAGNYSITTKTNINSNKIYGWRIKATKGSILNKTLGSAKGVIVPHQLVKAIDNVMLISKTAIPTLEEDDSQEE